MTGSASVSTQFTIPIPDANGDPGIYSLVVVANGFSSDPIQFAGPIWVDFSYNGTERGSFAAPYKTLHAALNAAATFPVAAGPFVSRAQLPSRRYSRHRRSQFPNNYRNAGGAATIGQ